MGCVYSSTRLREELESMPVGPRHFRFGRVLGEGGFGKVRAVQRRFDSSRKWFAMKELTKEAVVDRRRFEEVFRERDLLTALRHPRICNLYYAFQDDKRLFLVMDLGLGGDLRFQLNHNKKRLPFSERRTRVYAAQLIEALDYVHSQGVLHRDVKPENILMTASGWLMLTDFGIARETDSDGLCFAGSGTAGYMAPEMYSRAHTHDRTADWFALGVTLHEFMTKRRPFHGEDLRRAVRMRRALSASLEATAPLMPDAVGEPVALTGLALGPSLPPSLSQQPVTPESETTSVASSATQASAAGGKLAPAPPAPAPASVGAVTLSLSEEQQTRLRSRRVAAVAAAQARKMPVEHLASVGVTTEGIDFVRGLLAFERRRRLGHGGVAELKTHPWFRESADFKWDRITDGTHPVPFVPDLSRANVEPEGDLQAALLGESDRALRQLAPEEQQCFQGYEFDHEKDAGMGLAVQRQGREAEQNFRKLLRADTSQLGELPTSEWFSGAMTGGVRRQSTRSLERMRTAVATAQSAPPLATPANVGGSDAGTAVDERRRGLRAKGDPQYGGSGRSSTTSEAAAYSTSRSTQSELERANSAIART